MKTALIVALFIVVVAAVGFGAYQVGQQTGLTEATNIRSEFFASRTGSAANPQGAQGGAAQTGQGSQSGTNVRSQATRPVAAGTIKSIQGEIMEVTQQDGTTVTVALSAQTQIQKITAGATADLQVGERVSIQGVQATGQVNAQVIQISPGAQ